MGIHHYFLKSNHIMCITNPWISCSLLSYVCTCLAVLIMYLQTPHVLICANLVFLHTYLLPIYLHTPMYHTLIAGTGLEAMAPLQHMSQITAQPNSLFLIQSANVIIGTMTCLLILLMTGHIASSKNKRKIARLAVTTRAKIDVKKVCPPNMPPCSLILLPHF
jgi:hypothetical protein